MNIVDYDKKMDIIIDFYEQACELMEMIHENISQYKYVLYHDEGQHQAIIEKNKRRRKQLLIELGRVGEYCVKYILLLEQLKNYPNQTFEEFKNKPLYSLGDKGVRNTYINQYHMNKEIIDRILQEKEKHSFQPLHDYSYLFAILQILYPEVVKNIYEVGLLNTSYGALLDFLLDDSKKLFLYFFPHKIKVPIELGITPEQYLEFYDDIIKKSGDSFIRLRYFENNPDKKDYKLNSIIMFLDFLVDFLNLTHEINFDDLDKNVIVSFVKRNVINKMIEKKSINKVDESLLKTTEETKPCDEIIVVPLPLEKKYQKKINELSLEITDEIELEMNKINESFRILEKKPQILYSIDYDQMSTYNWGTEDDLSFEEMYDNFIENIIFFKSKPDILDKIPLILNPQNNKNVLNLLVENGLDLNMIGQLESDVLCFPFDLTNAVVNRMKDNNIPIFIENNINPQFYNILDIVRLENLEKEANFIPAPLPWSFTKKYVNKN